MTSIIQLLNKINYMDCDAPVSTNKLISRDYKCPCGKTYLSYPALFTHIKQKHDGKAPGQIEKPKLESKPRGRPPLSSKKSKGGNGKDGDVSKQTDSSLKVPEGNQQSRIYWDSFQAIFTNLRQIIFPQEIGQDIWDQVYSFRRFEEFIDSTQESGSFQYKGVNIGIGLTEFLKEVSVKTQGWRFQQVLILFMLLLQYVLDQNDNTSMIETAPVETLVEYMNPFINYHISDYSEFLGIDTLWVMNKNNMHNIFLCFYNWLKWKNYTDFCITLID